MAKTKIKTPAQKATEAQFKAEAAKAKAAAPAPAKDPKPAKAPKAPAKKATEGLPDHWTLSGNKKHQCNGPRTWSAVFQAAAKKELGATGREGDGVRLALALGVEALAKKHGIKIPATAPAADPRQTSHPAVAK